MVPNYTLFRCWHVMDLACLAIRIVFCVIHIYMVGNIFAFVNTSSPVCIPSILVNEQLLLFNGKGTPCNWWVYLIRVFNKTVIPIQNLCCYLPCLTTVLLHMLYVTSWAYK